MKPEEVKDALDYFKRRKEMYLDDLIQKRENVAIQALEKQVPKKPEMHIGDYEFERWPICPKCKGELHPNGEKFCSDCGQAIDWGNEE